MIIILVDASLDSETIANSKRLAQNLVKQVFLRLYTFVYPANY